jgi:8-oxo-dGTP diphosphatase
MKKMFKVSLEPPFDFSPSMEAAGCFFQCKEKILLVKRQMQKPQGGKWCLPGGKLEKNETPLIAILREIKEELGIPPPVELPKKMTTFYIELPPLEYLFHIFLLPLSSFPSITLNLEENSEAKWLTISEALKLPLISAGKEALLYYKNFPGIKKI